jgi:hypothetical protein
MLKVYIDDSNVGVEPVSVLAGWAATEETWASFEKDWSAALGMSPRLAYFKETEANGRSGEFAGWSDQSFADRMHLLMRIIADHNPFGLISAVPTKLYFEVFGKNHDKVLAYPSSEPALGGILACAYAWRYQNSATIGFKNSVQEFGRGCHDTAKRQEGSSHRAWFKIPHIGKRSTCTASELGSSDWHRQACHSQQNVRCHRLGWKCITCRCLAPNFFRTSLNYSKRIRPAADRV